MRATDHERLNWLLLELQLQTPFIEKLINATPTGELRNKLTEVNIFLGSAILAAQAADHLAGKEIET